MSPDKLARLFAANERLEVAYGFVVVGALLLSASLLRSREGERWEATSLGALALLLVGGIALQATAPALTPVLTWPLFFASLAAAFGGATRVPLLVLALALTLSFAHGVYLGVGIVTGAALAPFVIAAACVLHPLHAEVARSRAGRLAAAALVLGGLLLTASVRLGGP
jgi:hypothetical protein